MNQIENNLQFQKNVFFILVNETLPTGVSSLNIVP
jgi:hypothetical protein